MLTNRLRSLWAVPTFAAIALRSLLAAPAGAQSISIAVPIVYSPDPTRVVIIGEPTESADVGENTCFGFGSYPVQRAVVIRPGEPAQIVDIVVAQSDPLPVGARITNIHFCNENIWALYPSFGMVNCFGYWGEID